MHNNRILLALPLWAMFSCFFTVGFACQQSLREGDILFQRLSCGELCDAIETVTNGVKGKNFSHCGMVVPCGDSLCVVEALSEKVQMVSMHQFFYRGGNAQKAHSVVAGRLKKPYRKLIAAATAFAFQQIGTPYDDLFLPDNGKLYCSELVYQAFAQGGPPLFLLAPMTFKNPETKDFLPAWTTYYRQLDHAIPEGLLGINPGALSRSDKLKIFTPRLNRRPR